MTGWANISQLKARSFVIPFDSKPLLTYVYISFWRKYLKRLQLLSNFLRYVDDLFWVFDNFGDIENTFKAFNSIHKKA